MDETTRRLVRAAQEIRAKLLDLRRARWRLLAEKLGGVLGRLDAIALARRRLAVCAERGYEGAAQKCAAGVEPSLRDLSYQLQDVQRAPWDDAMPVPSARELLQDLRQLEDEFGEVKYQRRDKTLSVTTDPITLEDVALGPFDIVLDLPSLADARLGGTYDVVALAPNPAGANDTVTHPHVSDERLCPGDAGAAIQAALRSGRICDFFVMVRSVLTTYNPGSPYVRLEDWHGVSCYDCGYVMAQDDTHWCHTCENDFCSECASYCPRCDETTCSGCLEECPACEEHVCGECMTQCPDCDRSLCRLCLGDNECPCHEEEDDVDDDERDEGRPASAAATPGAPVLARGVGEADIPAGSR